MATLLYVILLFSVCDFTNQGLLSLTQAQTTYVVMQCWKDSTYMAVVTNMFWSNAIVVNFYIFTTTEKLTLS